MKLLRLPSLVVLSALLLQAQSDRGMITGTVTDPAGAVVPKARVVAIDSETGAPTNSESTETGNYTLLSLPAGSYRVEIESPGFKTFIASGITVEVAMTVRVDAVLQIGSTRESVVVTADAPLLRTENAEQSFNVTGNRINALPINFGGGGGSTGAVRDPLAFVVLSPGVAGNNSGAAINGLPPNSFRIMFEGQDTTSGNANARANETQGSVDAIEEFTLQTSNFAAEFGQVGGGLVNFTARSGSNQLHGSAYDYFANEALNAKRPFTGVNPISRKNDGGITLSGPIVIPKIYNGHNRTFFFANVEKYYNKGSSNGTYGAVPTLAMRSGDFSQILGTTAIGTDPIGRPIYENQIFNPYSEHITADGRTYRDPFPGNRIPGSLFDPVAAKIQALIPLPTNGSLTNNWNYNAISSKNQLIPSIKVDQILTSNQRVAFYYSKEGTHQYSSADGLPNPITAIRDQRVYSHTTRLNYDNTFMPTALLHLGVGYVRYLNPDSSPKSVVGNYDAAGLLGFTGGAVSGFPRLNGLNGVNSSGVVNITNGFGPTNANYYYNDKLTSVASASYVRSNHTYKVGAEFKLDMWTDRNARGSTGVLGFSAATTGEPYLNQTSIGGKTIGFPYASFLLGLSADGTGDVNSTSATNYVSPVQDPQLRKKGWGVYVQDTWKVTPRLTLDYGLRWDYEGQGHEIHDRFSMFGPTIPNPSAGGILGGYVYEGYGPGRCNCRFTNAYPFALGPRIGAAFQINQKTVFRAGFGVSYTQTPGWNYITNSPILGVGFNQIQFSNPQFGEPGVVLRNGLQYNQADLYSASLNPGILPKANGAPVQPNFFIDPNGARPGRVAQWTVGVQRQVLRDLVVEAAYVGNRGAWLNSNNLINLNAINPARLQALGINPALATDQALLRAPIGGTLAQQRGIPLPYANFPKTATVAQALRPFPQYTTIPVNWAPLGTSWYDSLQVKANKRYSHGLDVTGAFTWSKSLNTLGTGTTYSTSGSGSTISLVNNVFNRANQKDLAAYDQPFILAIGFNYETPRVSSNRYVRALTGGWTIGGLLHYSSGALIPVPSSQNNNANLIFQGTFMNRVQGQPLFLKNPNCGCIDPNKQFVLNPAAWSDPAPGTFGTSAAFLGDYRWARRPDEQMSIGRGFRITERIQFHVRAEFFNVFNRTYLPNPVSSNALQTQSSSGGVPSGGFGFINGSGNLPMQPRNGQIVGRFTF